METLNVVLKLHIKDVNYLIFNALTIKTLIVSKQNFLNLAMYRTRVIHINLADHANIKFHFYLKKLNHAKRPGVPRKKVRRAKIGTRAKVCRPLF